MPATATAPQTFPAVVVDVIDGDTIVLDVAVAWDLVRRVHCRVHGINCPERHSKNVAEQAAGLAAMTYAGVIAPAGSRVTFTYLGPDKYSERVQGQITIKGGLDFASAMVAAGFAKTWDGKGPRP